MFSIEFSQSLWHFDPLFRPIMIFSLHVVGAVIQRIIIYVIMPSPPPSFLCFESHLYLSNLTKETKNRTKAPIWSPNPHLPWYGNWWWIESPCSPFVEQATTWLIELGPLSPTFVYMKEPNRPWQLPARVVPSHLPMLILDGVSAAEVFELLAPILPFSGPEGPILFRGHSLFRWWGARLIRRGTWVARLIRRGTWVARLIRRGEERRRRFEHLSLLSLSSPSP